MPLVAEKVTQPRRVESLIAGVATSDGAGVKLTRVLTNELQQRLDPFLMLDAFGSDKADDYIAGFPDHPHRGFETVTYMLAGRMLHRDNAGHQGLLENGDVQWMTAGSGLIHSEIPQQQEGVMEGFQLWLNLPRGKKMCAPWYRDIKNAELPQFDTPQGAHVTVIAGQSHGVKGAIEREVTEPVYLDVHLAAGASFEQVLPATHNAFIYVYRGAVQVSDQAVSSKLMAIFANDSSTDGVRISASVAARFILIAGKPLNEPIVQYGPFVMNTKEEIMQAVNDYRAGKMGPLKA
jgi:redox-sensitive bicupin YhaK (pirin superfamily)